jgi:hypothetical protein
MYTLYFVKLSPGALETGGDDGLPHIQATAQDSQHGLSPVNCFPFRIDYSAHLFAACLLYLVITRHLNPQKWAHADRHRCHLGCFAHNHPWTANAPLVRSQGRADSLRRKLHAQRPHTNLSRLTDTLQSGKSIFLRNIDDPSICTQYTQHTAQTTVARFSPSGYYVASGDVSGAVKIWDCAGEGATKGALIHRVA